MLLLRRIARFLADTLILLLLGSILAAWLFRLTPGADSDPSDLTPGLSEETLAARRLARQQTLSTTGQSLAYFTHMLRGDLGKSTLSGAPVTELIIDRAPATAEITGVGALLGLLAGILVATAVVLLWPGIPETAATASFLALLSLPAGLLVLLAIFARLPLELAVGASVAPRVYFYAARLLAKQRTAGYVLHARAFGIPSIRIALHHVFPALRAELAALAGFAIVTALAAAIPAEALSGRPGIGQLAWRSAMERDLPVLVGVTLCLILAARFVTLLSAVPPRESRFAA